MITLPAGKTIRRAFFQYTGDSECRGWINDRDLGVRNNFRTVKYDDITARINRAAYAFGLTSRNVGPDPKPAGVVGLIEIEFTDGERLVVATDKQWKVSNHETAGWNAPAFDDSHWVSAKKLGPVGMQPWGEVQCGDDRRLPARWLRKEFTVEKKIRRATVSFLGLGSSELYLNGSKVGNRVVTRRNRISEARFLRYPRCHPPVAARPERHRYRARQRPFYSMRSRAYSNMPSYGFPKLLLQLRVELEDGRVSDIISATVEHDHRRSDRRQQRIRRRRIRRAAGTGRLEQSWIHASLSPRRGRAGVRDEGVSTTNERNFSEAPHPSPLTLSPPRGEGNSCATLMATRSTRLRAGRRRLRANDRADSRHANAPADFHRPNRSPAFSFSTSARTGRLVSPQSFRQGRPQVTLRHAETLDADGTLYLANLRGAAHRHLHTERQRHGNLGTALHLSRLPVTSKSPVSRNPTLAALAGRWCTTICHPPATSPARIR